VSEVFMEGAVNGVGEVRSQIAKDFLSGLEN
jgi:hypothetical protein